MTPNFITPTINRGGCIPNQHISKQNCTIDSVQYPPANPTYDKRHTWIEEVLQCFNLMLLPRPMKYASHTGFHPVWPSPSYGWKATLFGHVVSKIPEAWQSVSTISRSKLRLHKHFPNPTKTIWACREHLPHLLIQKWRDLDRWIFLNSPHKFLISNQIVQKVFQRSYLE
jgi:hypothetical protein